jgi:predicted SAM-dependent methyltransferase
MRGLLVDQVARYLARLRGRRRVPVRGTVVKVNVGAGFTVHPGWIHVDGSIHALLARAPAPVLAQLYRRTQGVRAQMTEREYIDRLRTHDFVFQDLTLGLPFADASVDYVYSSHVLEHFAPADADRLISEMQRVLKPGGLVRICVPDLAHAMALYQRGEKDAALSYFFNADPAEGYFFQHRYLYDFELLARLLAKHAFRDVRQCGFREGRMPDIQHLDNRPDETLFVEATRA